VEDRLFKRSGGVTKVTKVATMKTAKFRFKRCSGHIKISNPLCVFGDLNFRLLDPRTYQETIIHHDNSTLLIDHNHSRHILEGVPMFLDDNVPDMHCIIIEKLCTFLDIRQWLAKHYDKFPSIRLFGYCPHYHIGYHGENEKFVLKKLLDLVKN
jgi:hypothetical protein